MNRQEFLQYAWKQCRKTCETVVSWRLEPLADALETWDATQWVEVSPYLTQSRTPVFLPAGRQLVVLLAGGEGEEPRAWKANCPHCQSQVFWQMEEKAFRCPNCLRDFAIDASDGESLRSWPVRMRNSKVYVAKGMKACTNSL